MVAEALVDAVARYSLAFFVNARDRSWERGQ